jgi:Cdc6-like AAA superfamily ATPase
MHAIIYGERGVGKTSLANIIELIFRSEADRLVLRYNCDKSTTYARMWQSMLQRVSITTPAAAGFRAGAGDQRGTMRDQLPAEVTPSDILTLLTSLSSVQQVVVILDELDRIRDADTISLVADTMKALSDYDVDVTMILVGVADSVEQLIHDHRSVQRCLEQVRMPRMSRKELNDIIVKGLAELHMKIDRDARYLICDLAQGLPHYVHLITKYAAETAVTQGAETIRLAHVRSAMTAALRKAQESVQAAYNRAIQSPQQDNRFREVLLACSLAREDEMGFFAAADVKQPMCEIMRKPQYEVGAFSRHLNAICTDKRGPILQRTGTTRNHRYRFIDPLIEPYIIIRGITDGLVTEDILRTLPGTDAVNELYLAPIDEPTIAATD